MTRLGSRGEHQFMGTAQHPYVLLGDLETSNAAHSADASYGHSRTPPTAAPGRIVTPPLPPGNVFSVGFIVAHAAAAGKTATAKIWGLCELSGERSADLEYLGEPLCELALTGGAQLLGETGLIQRAVETDQLALVDTIAVTTSYARSPGVQIVRAGSGTPARAQFDAEMFSRFVVELRRGTAAGVAAFAARF